MGDSVYKIIEVVGTSRNSWEEATKNAVRATGESVRDLRIAEITKLDTVIDAGDVVAFRARVSLSFKVEGAAPAKKPKGKK